MFEQIKVVNVVHKLLDYLIAENERFETFLQLADLPYKELSNALRLYADKIGFAEDFGEIKESNIKDLEGVIKEAVYTYIATFEVEFSLQDRELFERYIENKFSLENLSLVLGQAIYIMNKKLRIENKFDQIFRDAINDFLND